MRVVNRVHINEVADEAGVLALLHREVAQLKAALLESRGGSVITADGEIVSAEEMLERQRLLSAAQITKLCMLSKNKLVEFVTSPA